MMADVRLAEMALAMVKQKVGFERLDIDCIGRVEIWFKIGNDLENCLAWIDLTDGTYEWIEAGRCGEIESKKDREMRAWYNVLLAAADGYDVGYGSSRSILIPRYSTIESLLVEKDLEMAEG